MIHFERGANNSIRILKKIGIKTIWAHSTPLYYDVFIVSLALWRTLRVSELNHDPDGIFLHFSQNVSILNLWGCSIFFYTSFWVKKTSRVSKLATIWSKNKVHSALNFFLSQETGLNWFHLLFHFRTIIVE